LVEYKKMCGYYWSAEYYEIEWLKLLVKYKEIRREEAELKRIAYLFRNNIRYKYHHTKQKLATQKIKLILKRKIVNKYSSLHIYFLIGRKCANIGMKSIKKYNG
jgi:hypothetical protein